jgi:hypothetical protein
VGYPWVRATGRITAEVTDVDPAPTPERSAGTPGRPLDPSRKEVTLSIPESELAALDAAVAEENVSRSYAIRTAVKGWLKGRKGA